MLKQLILILAWLLCCCAITSGQSTYESDLLRQLAPAGGNPTPLLGADADAVIQRLEAKEEEAKLATLSLRDVRGEAFARALRIDVQKGGSVFWKTSIQVRTTAPVKKGDIVWVIYQMRGGIEGLGGSEAVVSMGAKPGMPPWDPRRAILGRRTELNDSWQTIMLAGPAKEDLGAGQLRFDIDVGYQRQWIEVAGMMAYNLGPNADVSKLPLTTVQTPTTYEGREPNAPWRKSAAERIAQHRQAPLTVRVVDGQGKPVVGAAVSVDLRKHAFHFGSALDGWLYMADTPEGKDLPASRDGRWVIHHKGDPASSDSRRYRDEARRLFNTAAPENDLKGYRIMDGPLSVERSRRHAQQFVRRLNEDGFDVYGHVLVWPGFSYSPKAWRPLAPDPVALRATVEDYIRQTMNLFDEDQLIAWDVVNEPYGNHELQNIFGKESLADWFKLARSIRPKLDLHLNEAARPGTKQVEMRTSLHEHLRLLQSLDAPITGVGLQCHYGHPPSIESIKAELDAYAAYGIDIWITEFDIYASAPDVASREALEADFLRDFYTLCFSHPAVRGVTMWGFWDGLHWKGRAPIFRKDWSLKPSGQQYIDLVHGAWKTSERGATNDQGVFSTRGFLGEYQVKVRVGEKEFVPDSATLRQPGTEIVVTVR